jgi:hypothetical protein
MSSFKRVLSVAAIVCVWFGMAPSIDAQIVAFFARGSDNVYEPASGNFRGRGQATHLGKCRVLGNAVTTPTSNPLVFDWVGHSTLVAANGDELYFNGGGQVTLTPLGGTMFSAVWTANFNITGGTGRFTNAGPASAPLSVVATNEPFDLVNDPEWIFSWQIAGQINLGRR